ncbi:MAG: CPBP family intramembrane glutamic endopeptidase [Pyrobaculum sp.]
MEYKDNMGDAAAGLAILLLAVVVLALAPRPLGYLAVLALVPLLRRRVVWARFAPSYLAASSATYLAAFVLDYVFVGVPGHLPPWWEAVVLAPLAEELVFRALAFALLPPPPAWLFAVVLFGLLHPANPLVASLYGASLALMYRGGGYVASVVLHAVNNAVWLALATGLL